MNILYIYIEREGQILATNFIYIYLYEYVKIYVFGGIPQNQNLVIKNCVFILICLKLSHLQSSLHLMPPIHLSRLFSHCSKQFLKSSILMPFSAPAFFFCLNSSTSAKCFPLTTFFPLGKQKFIQGKIGWIERVGHRGHAVLGQKLLNTQHSVGNCSCKSPTMKWANVLKASSKKFTGAECSLSHNTS